MPVTGLFARQEKLKLEGSQSNVQMAAPLPPPEPSAPTASVVEPADVSDSPSGAAAVDEKAVAAAEARVKAEIKARVDAENKVAQLEDLLATEKSARATAESKLEANEVLWCAQYVGLLTCLQESHNAELAAELAKQAELRESLNKAEAAEQVLPWVLAT